MPTGRLLIRTDNQGNITGFRVEQDNGTRRKVNSENVSDLIQQNIYNFNQQLVEYENNGNQIVNVRPINEPAVPQMVIEQGQVEAPPHTRAINADAIAGPENVTLPDFRNPYNFVPALPRPIGDEYFGDHRPIDQDRFHKDRYTGRIDVEMIAKTPILLPDAQSVTTEANGHKTFPLRLKDGKPWIPSSSLRGMLRSAYEIITTSRFAVFPQEIHKECLKYRDYPNKISYPASPWELLHESLRPATSLDQLSPADRVFGWVRAEKNADEGKENIEIAYKSRVRVGPVQCLSNAEEAIENFHPTLPLNILSTPKPQQAKFYVVVGDIGVPRTLIEELSRTS
ncbi:hypothetical protein J4558_25985 [Leptolyngbya sp. 15MV]|nr:hypothetical protein J4558_25985 [Leptolyngbya sp. 15MV]